ncbi:hypothetical protein Q5P01_001024 [Channa striata]|uniref:Uncharacterized protein n=1 Tax=Channa striata TaxID=64152 RepID=A0AA88IIY3_CHASR|nr:hypothetical protein Q5P01_001024 [Channa striata]
MQARHSERDTFVEGLLDYWEDDAAEAPRYGAVRPIRSGTCGVMVALCLATEDSRSFLVILKTVNPCLFEDLVERGPQGKMEKSLPADASDSEGQSVLRGKAWRRACYISVS